MIFKGYGYSILFTGLYVLANMHLNFNDGLGAALLLIPNIITIVVFAELSELVPEKPQILLYFVQSAYTITAILFVILLFYSKIVRS